ncbi:type I pullulanase [Aquibacillus salsiterrae]|uniref:Type I pullulanase n=1 Tax=Aquibacillus salsiterrae TaxID=2950439 RepID=A0A9X4AF54_9BACI|nr:type I pullulanase [Aquibacillus salsiterrae]MDC3417637.1 type I pullulanase [Aquibacillus salsiterrae]
MNNYCGWIDDKSTITFSASELEQKPLTPPIIKSDDQPFTVDTVTWNDTTATIILKEILPMNQAITLTWNEWHAPVYPRGVVRTDWFEQKFDASTVTLGASYTKAKTTFTIWAPTATKLILVLQNKQYLMSRNDNGVWETTIESDCHLFRYYYLVTVNGEEHKLNDPYAKGLTANSAEGVVLELSQTNPSGFLSVTYPHVKRADAIIYELHVRDATSSSHSGVTHRGKYLGLTERDTTSLAGYSTGLSYIRELGCTHVQLLPLQDFARVDELNPDTGYNWGYDPLFFFTPEGSYASDANDSIARIKECKQMIQALHEEGLSVILDVVFNHVYQYETSVFEKLVPGYYFRYHSNGEMSNATGTGNDLATERIMVQKFILDCVDYWLTEYQIDGFRFDLMGIIDTETMQKIKSRVAHEKRPILLLGEGWELATPLPSERKSTISQSHQLPGISFFNDQFRDRLKGNLFDAKSLGYVNGNGHYFERMAQLVAGSSQARFGDVMYTDPVQSVNYVECHDNHTLWDRLLLTNPEATEQERKRMHELATGLTLISQGIPFIHAGQEFYRTKQGDENSYLSGDAINQLDWERRGQADTSVQWVRKLIQLRKQFKLFRLDSTVEIEHRLHMIMTPAPVLGFMLAGDDEDLVALVNPTKDVVNVDMPALGLWEKLISNCSGGISPVSCLLEPNTQLASYELAIFIKRRL